jgi:hypothetical protein
MSQEQNDRYYAREKLDEMKFRKLRMPGYRRPRGNMHA